MKTSEKINEISAALAKAQAAMGRAVKEANNPHFNKKYADLSACWDACQGPLTENGIAVLQANKPTDKGVTVETRLVHSSGQWIEDDGLFVPASKVDAQGFGSALTYCRRYSLCAMVGIAPEDDDGNAAAASARKPATATQGEQPPPKPAPKPAADKAKGKAKPDFASTLATVPTIDSLDRIAKANEWVEKEIIAGNVTPKQAEEFCIALAVRATELCNDLADYEKADALMRDMGGKLRIHDAKVSDLRIKLDDAKTAKLGAAA